MFPKEIDLPVATPDGPVVRDDEAGAPALRDKARDARKRRSRLKIVDTGRLSISELEDLAAAGADIHTSDAARPDVRGLVLVAAAGRRGGSGTVFLHHGPLAESAGPDSVPMAGLLELCRSGLDVHLSNRSGARQIGILRGLAAACRAGGGVFVYYHHGALEPGLEDLAREGAWIHASSRAVATAAEAAPAADLARASRAAGARFLIHVDGPAEAAALRDLAAAGARLLFHTAPSDYRSPLRPLEDAARRRREDPRAFYLYRLFMP